MHRMQIEILGDFPKDQLYCAGSVTKFLTTFVILSYLRQLGYQLKDILDDENFLTTIAVNAEAKSFLQLMQCKIIGKFTLRDLCTYYTGLPYTFDPTPEALEKIAAGQPFKHHSLVVSEEAFLQLCEQNVSALYPNRSKYHYSELSIIFMAFLFEKITERSMEDLYDEFIVKRFQLTLSRLSRKRPADVYTQDLSDKVDYAAVAIMDHGYFVYSNSYYTTLNEMKQLLEAMHDDAVFQLMIDVEEARAAATEVMNGLSIELRQANGDLIYGYEGLSASGCNIFSCSRAQGKGYILFCNDEEKAYELIYQNFGITAFEPVTDKSRRFSQAFADSYAAHRFADIPPEFQGQYKRVKINGGEAQTLTTLSDKQLHIHNPSLVTYDLLFAAQSPCIQGEDGTHESRIRLYQSQGKRFLFFDGSAYELIQANQQQHQYQSAMIHQ